MAYRRTPRRALPPRELLSFDVDMWADRARVDRADPFWETRAYQAWCAARDGWIAGAEGRVWPAGAGEMEAAAVAPDEPFDGCDF